MCVQSDNVTVVRRAWNGSERQAFNRWTRDMQHPAGHFAPPVGANATPHVAPPTFIHLDGEFGLASEDRGGWRQSADRAATTNPARASLHEACSFMSAQRRAFLDGRHFYVPVTTSFGVTYEPTDSDVVRFLRPAIDGVCLPIPAMDGYRRIQIAPVCHGHA